MVRPISEDARSIVTPASVTYQSTDINAIGTVTGRLGFAADKFLIYAKGGWATANVDISGRNMALPDAFSFSDRRNGWTVGTGVEYMVARNFSLGVEYSYIDLGSQSYAGLTTPGGIPFTVTNLGYPDPFRDGSAQLSLLSRRAISVEVKPLISRTTLHSRGRNRGPFLMSGGAGTSCAMWTDGDAGKSRLSRGFDHLRQPPLLPPLRVEVPLRQPLLVRPLQRRPFAVDDREPGGVAVAALVDDRLPEQALVLEARAAPPPRARAR